MTKDDIIRMALEAGFEGFRGEHPVGWGEYAIDTEIIERFAALVAAAEREACAKVCGDMLAMTKYEKIPQEVRFALYEAENAIRARGQE